MVHDLSTQEGRNNYVEAMSKKTLDELKVGDTVSWSGSWGKDPAKDAVVEGIDHNGDAVESIAWSEVYDRNVCVTLDNGHWTYGSQIEKKRGNSDRIKSLFETYFDGCYDVEPQYSDNPSTYSMGVCKLEFDDETNTLTVHLRRPGLLIGKEGRTINNLKEWLECHVSIVEVKKF